MIIQKYPFQLAIVFCLFFISGWVGIKFAGIAGGSLTLIWLPSGVSLAAYLLFGLRIWPAVLFGSFCANTPYLIDDAASYPLIKAASCGLLAAAIDTFAQVWLASRLYERYIKGTHLRDKSSVLNFVFRVTLIPSIANIIPLFCLFYSFGFLDEKLADPNYHIVTAAFAGILGDYHGFFVITPLAISWLLLPSSTAKISPQTWLIAIFSSLCFVLLFAASILWQQNASIYIMAALGVLITMRFGSRGASLFMLALSLSLTFATVQKLGPFVYESEWQSFITLLVFILGIGIPVHLLAAEGNERQAALENLEDKVKTRTQQLEAAKQVAEEANKDKSHFLAAASHDLRQPLHALNLHIQHTKHSTQTDLSGIEESAQGLSTLLNEILDLSKLDAGGIEINLSSIPSQNILDALRRDFQSCTQEKGIAFNINSSTLCIQTDFFLLLRILQNITNNAVRYTDTGSINIQCQQEGEFACFSVQDTGHGISQANTGKIFNEFYQVENNARNRSEGIGLGLSIVKRLCDSLGYTLNVESKIGSGSCFSVYVPLSTTVLKTPQAPTKTNITSLQGASILVIDNDRDILDITTNTLKQWKCAAISAASLEEALKLCEHEQIDLILCDYRLHESMTGLELIQQLNAQLTPPAAAIVITGDTAPHIIEAAHNLGYGLLHKPVTNEALLQEAILRELSR